MDWHRPRLDALIEAGVDLLAFETIPSIKEGLAVFNKLVTKFHLKFYKPRMKVNYVLEIHLNKLMNFFVIIHK
jgi:S-methylmethionine-dependent homocysteine/selenocysteine methylase